MSTYRVLLFGGSGQLGKAIRNRPLPGGWQLHAPARAECDLMQPGAIAKAVQGFEPDLVINAAAMVDIDACEKDPDKAQEINFHAVANIAAQCDTASAPLIQISTDYVFDGKNDGHAYLPDDAMNPVNAYGKTKMLGEEAARHGLHWHVVLRTSLVFSGTGQNVLTKTLRQIDSSDEVQAVTDQKANPTSADAVAEAILSIGNAIMNGKGDGFGTFHISGEPAVSRYEFLQAIMEAYAPLTSRRPRLTGIASADQAGRVPRPASTFLNNDKARAVYGIKPSLWRDDLARAVKEYVSHRVPS